MSAWDANLNPLKDELSFLYVREDDYRAFVREVGLKEQDIPFTGKARTDWLNILEEAQKAGNILAIIRKARERFQGNTVLQVAECYVQKNGDSKIKILSIGLSKSVKEVFECCARLQQTIQYMICWQDMFMEGNKRTLNYNVSPDDFDQIQASLSQLSDSLKLMYQAFNNDDSLRYAFGAKFYEFKRILGFVANQQLDELITKMQGFKNLYITSSMIAIEWGLEVQKKIVDVVQNLQEIDNLMPLEWQQRVLEAETIPLETVTDSAFSQVNSDHTVTPSTSEGVIKPMQVKKAQLRKAILRFYDSPNELTVLCSDLAEEFEDENMKYDNLDGGTPRARINYLVNRFYDHNIYDKLVLFLIKNPQFKVVLHQIIQE